MLVLTCKPHAALQAILFTSAQTLSRIQFLLDKWQVDLESGAAEPPLPPFRTGDLDLRKRLILELACKLAESLPVTQINGG